MFKACKNRFYLFRMKQNIRQCLLNYCKVHLTCPIFLRKFAIHSFSSFAPVDGICLFVKFYITNNVLMQVLLFFY